MSIRISKQCIMCRKVHFMNVSEEGWDNYLLGMHAQDALPELSADERELLISGICGTCFDNLFSEEEDDEED